MKVIGAMGQNGSGKDEVTKHVHSRYGVPLLSSGDIVREIAATEGLEPTRANLQAISERYFRQSGKGCFIRLIAERIRQNGWDFAAISGIRSLEDITILKNAFGEDFILIHVSVTDPHIRYGRMRERGEERDPPHVRAVHPPGRCRRRAIPHQRSLRQGRLLPDQRWHA